MPAPDSFVDTNILLYAISTEPSEAAKAAAAQHLLSTVNWAWSAQVAAEDLNHGQDYDGVVVANPFSKVTP
jgi:predicted nucleic acid-binding protein